MSDMLIMESNIQVIYINISYHNNVLQLFKYTFVHFQAISTTVDREVQTLPKIKDNKCIQSIIEEEQLNQPQPEIKSEKVLDDFLLKNVPK